MRACSLRWIAVFSLVLPVVLCGGCNSHPQEQGGTAGPMAPAQQSVDHPLPPAVALPSVQILSVGFQKEGNSGTLLLSPVVENSGPGAAEIDGNCQWKCSEPGTQVSGGLGLAATAFVNAGERRTLEGNATTVCDNHPAPLTLSCSFSVRAVDASGHPTGDPKLASWNGQVAIPK